MARTSRRDNWAQRYLGSNHHTDRFVDTQIKYEDASGQDYRKQTYFVTLIDDKEPKKRHLSSIARESRLETGLGPPSATSISATRYRDYRSLTPHRTASPPPVRVRDYRSVTPVTFPSDFRSVTPIRYRSVSPISRSVSPVQLIRAYSPTPDYRRSITPERIIRRSVSPVVFRDYSPVPDYRRSITPERVYRRSVSPVTVFRDYSPVLDYRRSITPERFYPRPVSPGRLIRDYSPVPDYRRSITPERVYRRSVSPLRVYRPSTVRRSISPVRVIRDYSPVRYYRSLTPERVFRPIYSRSVSPVRFSSVAPEVRPYVSTYRSWTPSLPYISTYRSPRSILPSVTSYVPTYRPLTSSLPATVLGQPSVTLTSRYIDNNFPYRLPYTKNFIRGTSYTQRAFPSKHRPWVLTTGVLPTVATRAILPLSLR